MKAYLLTAAGVIFVSVVVSLLVPEGKLNKSITFIMRLICILVLIQPITGIFKLTDKAVSSEYIDYEYVSSVYAGHQGRQLEKLLMTEFDAETECTVKVECTDGEFKVAGAEVVLSENNKDLIDKIYEYLQGRGYINITVYAEST